MENVGLKRGVLEIMNYQDDYPSIYEREKEAKFIKMLFKLYASGEYGF